MGILKVPNLLLGIWVQLEITKDSVRHGILYNKYFFNKSFNVAVKNIYFQVFGSDGHFMPLAAPWYNKMYTSCEARISSCHCSGHWSTTLGLVTCLLSSFINESKFYFQVYIQIRLHIKMLYLIKPNKYNFFNNFWSVILIKYQIIYILFFRNR